MSAQPTDNIDDLTGATDIPKWQKQLIDTRLTEYNRNPADTLDWDKVSKELDEEDRVLLT